MPPGIIKDAAKKPKHIYEILDNRSTPFLVFDYGDHVDVYNQKYNEATNHHEIQGIIMQAKYVIMTWNLRSMIWKKVKGEAIVFFYKLAKISMFILVMGYVHSRQKMAML